MKKSTRATADDRLTADEVFWEADVKAAGCAKRISLALDKMLADLHPYVAQQLAFELLVRRLTQYQPEFMQLLIEDPEIKEAHWATMAKLPATAKLKGKAS